MHSSSPFCQFIKGVGANRRANAPVELANERELDQENRVEYLQIRRRWLRQPDAVPAFYPLDCGRRSVHFRHCDDRQINVLIDRFVMVEGDLRALASGILFGRRCLRFAMAVGRTATLRPSEHEILFAGNAAVPPHKLLMRRSRERTELANALRIVKPNSNTKRPDKRIGGPQMTVRRISTGTNPRVSKSPPRGF